MDIDSLLRDYEDTVDQWCLRDIFRRTNWLYIVDALRPRDIRKMMILLELVDLCQSHAQTFIVWASTLSIY